MSDEKKIIVDEDWKTQVAAEKEALARGASSESAPAASPASADLKQPAAAPQMPPASFEMLVTTLATEAMIGMGQIPHPLSDKVHPDPEQARYAIDMLEMLAEKTKGNLTPGEDRGMRDLLHQLRMAFVASQKAPVTSRSAEASGS